MRVTDSVNEYVKFLSWCGDNAHEIAVPTALDTLANRYVRNARTVKVPAKWFQINRKKCLGQALGDLEWIIKIDTMKLCKIYFILGLQVHKGLRKQLPPNVKLNESMQIIKMGDKRNVLRAKEAESGSESEPEMEEEPGPSQMHEPRRKPEREPEEKQVLKRKLERRSSPVLEPKRKREREPENMDELEEEEDLLHAQHQYPIVAQDDVEPGEPMEQQVFEESQDQDNDLDDRWEEEMDQFEDDEEDNYLVYNSPHVIDKELVAPEREEDLVVEPDDPTEHQVENDSELEPEPEVEQEPEWEQEEEQESERAQHQDPIGAQAVVEPDGPMEQQVFEDPQQPDDELDDGDEEEVEDDEGPVAPQQDHVDTLVEKFLNELEKCFLRNNKEHYKNMLKRIRMAHKNATKQGHNIDRDTICAHVDAACDAVVKKGVRLERWAVKGDPRRDLQFVHELFDGMLDTFSDWVCILREPVEQILMNYRKKCTGKMISNKSIGELFGKLADKLNEKINTSREG